jgi:hypothetical protein
MPSTYTTNGGIELPANGEQSGTWGETVNDNMAIIDRLTNGVGAISLSGTTHTLTTADGTLSDGQYNVLVLGGSPSGTNTITISPNDGEHVYVVKNASGQTATFTQGSGANVSVLNNTTKIIYADGAGAGAAVVDITGALDLGSLIIAGTAVTATAAELNILDGVTSTTAELNILDGVTSTTAELNILDGVTATAAELNYNDITTLGTVQASKTVTADASGDVLFPDGDKAIFGAGSDLEIYHDGTNNRLTLASANTYIQTDGIVHFTDIGNNEKHLTINDDGAVDLYHNNALKLATTATGIDVTGTVAAGAGTALLPSITTTGDLNTGMWFPAADTIAFSEGGVEALRIDSSGNVGIGTTSPSTFGKFAVVGGSAYADGGYFAKNSSSTADTILKMPLTVSTLFLRPNGDNTVEFFNDVYGSALSINQTNVGIGTNSPITKLDVYGAQVLNRGVIQALDSTAQAAGTGAGLVLGGFYSPSQTTSGVQIKASKTNGTSSDYGFDMSFLTLQNGTSNLTERMRIDSSGNVGIGTSSPAHVLHLASSAPNLRIEDTDGGYADINVAAGSIELRSDQGNTQATSTLKMFVDGSEVMRIDSSGRVGIGTSSPDALLHVEAADGAVGGAIRYTSTGVASVYMSADGAGLCLATDTAGITFRTGVTGNDPTDTGSEAMRIDSSGDLSVGHAGGLGPIRISAISTVADFAMYLRNDHATTPYGIAIKFLTEQNDTGSSFLNCVDGAAQRFTVTPNGGLANYQANDSNLSDELEKNQFGQLDSTSDCVRSWEIVKYLYKDEDQTNPHKYGVIAQQIEEHCPEVITNWVKVKASDEVLWSEEDNDIPEGVSVGDVKTEAVEQVDRMAVKEQQMFWMLVKSHQEALNKIEAMEIRLSALEG